MKRELKTKPQHPHIKKSWTKPEIKSTLPIKETLSGGPGGVDMMTLIPGMGS
jgi:hypothetical protein